MSYQQRLRFVVERVGGQSELARRVNVRYGYRLVAQNVQMLLSKRDGKPAQSSRYTPQFAAVAGVRAEWLATGRGPREIGAEGESATRKVQMRLVNTSEDLDVDVTAEGLIAVQEFMALTAEDRKAILKSIRQKHKARLAAAPAVPRRAPAVKLPRKTFPKPK
jgi:hypothetical protein